MLKGRNELHLNKATIQRILTDWLKASWPSEAGSLTIVDIDWDISTGKVMFTMEDLPAPDMTPSAPPPQPTP